MKKALKDTFKFLFTMYIIMPLISITALLLLWAIFCFLIWDMHTFLTFFSFGKNWTKAFLVWRLWVVSWGIIAGLNFFTEVIKDEQ